MKVRVHVTPRRGVLDPQGLAVAGGLRSLGFSVGEVRVGKAIDVELAGSPSPEDALEQARRMARTLLANEVVEDFDVEILG